MTEVLGADDDRLRAARAVGRDGAAAAARRRDVVPGVLRAGHRQQPRRPHVPGGAHRRRLARHRPEGVDEPGAVRAALRAAHPHRHARVGAPRASPRCSSTWTRRASRRARSRRCTASPSSARCSSTTCSCRSTARSATKATGWAVAMDLLPYERSTALWHRAAFLHRRLAETARRWPTPGCARSGQARRGHAAPVRVPGPVARDAAPHGRAASRSARRRRSTRCCWPPSEQAVFDLVGRRAAGDGDASATTSTAPGGAASSCTRGRRRSTAAAPRSSATSSPAACSTSGTTDERVGARGEDLELFERSLRARDRTAHRRRARRRARRARLARRAVVRHAGRGVDAVRAAGRSVRDARRRSIASSRSRSGRELDGDTAVVLPADRSVADAPVDRAGDACAASRRSAATLSSYLVTVGSIVDAARARDAARCTASTPTSGLVEVTARSTLVDADAGRLARRASQLAQLALAHELVGVSRRMLALAREHALERVQFDQPIAKFQAVRHRLAETLVAIETADAVARRRVARPHAGHRGDGQGDRRAQRTRRRPGTASRCSPASASPPSTTCTATCGACWCSTSSSARARVLTKQLGEDLLAHAELPPLLPL